MIYTSNYLAIAVAVVANFALGWLWYGVFFKKMWMELSGHTQQTSEEMKKSGATPMRGYIVNLLLGIVTPFVFFSLADSLALVDFKEVLILGKLLWLGFMVPVSIGSVLWEGKSWKLFFLNAGQLLATMIVMSVVYFWMA